MSSLWNARVEEADGARIALRVVAVHPDAGDVPESAVFALRLLADGLDRAAGAPSAARRTDSLSAPGRAGEVVCDLSVTERRNFPFAERAARDSVEAVLRDRGLDPADTAAWRAAFDREWTALWYDPLRVPSAKLTVRLRDAEPVAPLKVGDRWDSAAVG
ncbi:hypothetical protein GCM10018793_64220 [Streptomyces sulfonofaciens]|uniref:Uncharacterized protein n=1 Tax=Streptomyces sulfonofaciens TaxID=68272 RepID=A0A919L9R4_9ACTN|nr:hypothetical protein [Streptomyces sulfonofaciens]GHH87641.1 hypothetical protein GCM10018793_64220 [Streptomyces sulfonofaciens]